MANRTQLRQESLTKTRAATIATEDTDGIVKLKNVDTDNATKVEVRFEDDVPLDVDYLIRHQGFTISCRSSDSGITVFDYSHN